MPDLDGAHLLGNGIPLLGQPASPPGGAAPPQTVVMNELTIGHTLGTDENGVTHALLTFLFTGPSGPSPTVVLILQDDDLLQFPDAVRKIVREARGKAEVANLDRELAEDKPDVDGSEASDG